MTTKIEALQMHVGDHDAQLNSILEAIENLLEDKVDKEFEQEKWKTGKELVLSQVNKEQTNAEITISKLATNNKKIL